MDLIIGFLIAVAFCNIFLLISNIKEGKSNDTIRKSSKCLYNSSNRNSYKKACEIFKTLENANIELDFLGDDYEQKKFSIR